MESSQLHSILRIARTVMIVAFGIFFICAPFFLMEGTWIQKAAVAALGVVIIAFEIWQWKRYKRPPA